jgi:ankyrin repeat protein
MDPTYALRSLKWVTCAKRPLHVDELKEAIAFSSNDRTWDRSKIPTDNHKVVYSCANLIVLDKTDNTVRLAHHTVKEFLFSKDRLDSLKVFKFDPQRTDLEVGEACITYLSFSNFRPQVATTNASQKQSVLPPVAAISALSGRPGLADRLARPLFSRTGQRKRNIFIPPEVSIASTRYRLLEYARVNWPMHAINISETSSLWGSFKDLALEPNRPWKLQPWGSNTNSDDTYYRSLFEWAIDKEHLPLISLLRSLHSRDRFAEFSKQPLRNGGLPLHCASRQGLEHVVELLLQVCNANAADENGDTALHQAAITGRAAVVRLLLTVKDLKVNLKSKRKRTALSLAAENGHETIVQMLIEKGAELETKDSDGRTALQLATMGQHVEVVLILLEKGAKVKAKGEDGKTVLHLAAENGHEAVVRLLLEHEADVNAEERDGETALHWAAKNGHEGVVRLLLEHKADVNAKQEDGWRALHLAAVNGHEAVVRLLLEHEADVNAKQGDGWGALHLAAENGHEAVMRLLLEHKQNGSPAQHTPRRPSLARQMGGNTISEQKPLTLKIYVIKVSTRISKDHGTAD